MRAVEGEASLSRGVEGVVEEAELSGALLLQGRGLRDFPAAAANFDLSDTTVADLSGNRLSKIPTEVAEWGSLEELDLHRNVIKSVPSPLFSPLKALRYLDLSENQISELPSSLCRLPLEVLLLRQNRLASLPPDLPRLGPSLKELDLSANRLPALPSSIGALQALQVLNLRANHLTELPPDVFPQLRLVVLDLSENRLARLPLDLRHLTTVKRLVLHDNPFVAPPIKLTFKSATLTRRSPRQDPQCILESPDAPPPSHAGFFDEVMTALSNKASVVGHNLSRIRSGETSEDGSPTPKATPNRPSLTASSSTSTIVDARRALDLEPVFTLQRSDELRSSSSSSDSAIGASLARDPPPSTSASVPTPVLTPATPVLSTNSVPDKRLTPPPAPPPPPVTAPPPPKETTPLRVPGDAPKEKDVNANRIPPVTANGRPKKPKSTSPKSTSPAAAAVPSKPKEPRVVGKAKSGSPMNGSSTSLSNSSSSSLPSRRSSTASRPNKSPPAPPAPVAKGIERIRRPPRDSLSTNHAVALKRAAAAPKVVPAATPVSDAQLRTLRQSIEGVLGISLPEEEKKLSEALGDGVHLCNFLNKLRLRSIPTVHSPTPAIPLSPAKCRRNVENFIIACRRLGVPQKELVKGSDIGAVTGLGAVGRSVAAALRSTGTRVPKVSAV